MTYLYDSHGWYEGASEAPAPRSTPDAPPSFDQPTTPGEPRANWTGREWRVLPYVIPVLDSPAPTDVPQAVTRAQAKKALLLGGILDAVQPAIDAIEDATQRGLVQIDWDERPEFRRDSDTLIALGSALGLTSEQIDDLFRAAAMLD